MNNNEMTKEDMLMKIKEYQFSIIELALYLDTHPEDEKALCLHRKYANILKDLMDKYQKVYGPLTINYPCNKWRWLEEPWPSFILGVTTYLQFFSLSKGNKYDTKHFNELLERIKTIRASERMAYQKITDLFIATAVDYNSESEEAYTFLK